MNKLTKKPKQISFILLSLISLVFVEYLTTSSGSGLAFAAPNCPAGNHIVCENTEPGNPASEWDINGAGDSSIQGFTTDISVNLGETVRFKIDTPSPDYRLDIYRMGYYGGNGARLMATVQPSAALPQNQPACLTNSTGLMDCGNWAESASWAVPADATSGIYFAKAVREDGGNAGLASHIFFVVRDDASTADLLFQTSDTTWQAYNNYGGNNLYGGSGPGSGLSGGGRAYKVSYNRPFVTRNVDNGQDWVFNAEYPMVRWLEANGYDMSYMAGIDSDRRGNLIANHSVFMSVAHDEYWSGGQRTNVEAARDAGVHLAFFSGNEVFWKIRWENSIDGSGTPFRTLVCYKETHEGAKIDPLPGIWTGTWRDPRFSPPADGGRPENELTGVIFGVNGGSPASTDSIRVPSAFGNMRFWRNTSAANQTPGNEVILPFGTLGYEWDEELDNGFRPAGLIQLSSTTINNAPILIDFGSLFGSAPATHTLTLYRDVVGGSLVFGAGTVQWAWGLDSTHDRAGTPSSVDMQQATVNLFADMGVQPDTLQPGLVAASASTDNTAPVSTITSPADGGNVPLSTLVTISGTATDVGGQVGGVEVSVDGGLTWSAASGRENWTFDWTTPPSSASVTILSRATDDSLNTETPGPGNTVSVTPGNDTTPPTVIAESPLDASTGVGLNPVVTATFSEAIQASSVTNSTFELREGTNLIAATVSASGNTATLSPSAPLTANTTYSVTVRGGAGGVEDLSGNVMAADNTWQFTTGTSGSPNCFSGTSTLWPATTTPAVLADPDTLPIELGVKFTSDIDGFICGVRFYKAISNTGTHVGNLWTIGGQLLASATFTNETNSGWQQVSFANPVAVTANTTYVASYHAPVGQYSVNEGYFNGFEQVNAPLRALENAASGGNGVFLAGPGGFPINTFQSSNYWVDVVFTATTIGDTTPPVVNSVSPADSSTDVSPSTPVTAAFSEALDPATVNATTFELRDSGNTLVPATVGASGITATLTPNAPLAPETTYTATIKGGAGGVKDLGGNPLAADQSWQFTTATSGAADCGAGTSTIWPASTVPALLADPDTSPVELGVKFTADVDGFICGIRFYKSVSNTGTHVGNLWTVGGTLLATATFTNETNSGWQQVDFSTPVAVTAATTYVASYHAPVGQYSIDAGYFDGFEQVNPPLRALENAASGGNGVFLSGPGGFPINTFNSSNYWVDVVFTSSTVGDSTPPTVTTVTPANNSTGVSPATAVTAVFSEALDLASIDTSTFELRDPGNTLIAATVNYSGITATLTPNALLLPNTTYTATVKGGASGVKDLVGNAMASDQVWQFTTAATGDPECLVGTATIWPETTTPAVASDPETSSIELGVKFNSDIDGFICGIRFFKGTANTGTHVGNLWTSSGQLLATATFVNESNSGWQQVNFASPVAITANTTYVASYHAPVGRYSINQGYFDQFEQVNPPLRALENGASGGNGVFLVGPGGFPTSTFQSSNYWVDVVFTANTVGDSTAPTVTSVTPLDNSTDVDPATQVTAVFSEPLDPASVTATTFTLQAPGSVQVAAAVSYTGNTATLTPAVPLAGNTIYTATVVGGPSGVRDLAGNALAADQVWQFTTVAPPTACSVELDFESGSAGWTNSPASTCSTGAFIVGTPTQFISGSGVVTQLAGDHTTGTGNAFFTATNTSIGVNDVDGGECLTESPNYAVNQDSEISIWYYHGQRDNGDDPAGDYFRLEYTVDGGTTWTSMASHGDQTLNAQWTQAVASVNGGSTVRIRVAASDGASTGDIVEAGIDDLSICPIGHNQPPSITAVSPADNSSDVDPAASISAVFSEEMNATTINSTTFLLQGPGGPVAATVSYNGNTATLTPSAPLTGNTTYSATVKGGPGGVQDLAGDPLPSDQTWQFTVAPETVVFIQTGFDVDTGGFGYIDDAFRNTNQPVYASGARLANGGFSGAGLQVVLGGLDTNDIFGLSGGWQQNFVLDAPTDVTVSFRYNLTQAANFENDEFSQMLLSVDGVLEGAGAADFIAQFTGDGNGGTAQTTGWILFVKNLGVLSAGTHNIRIGGYNNKKTWDDETTEVRIDDVLVSGVPEVIPPDTTAPSVTSVSPADNATGVDPATNVSAVFSEALDPLTVNATTFELLAPGAVPVAASVSYSGNTATLTPASPLTANTAYTAIVRGGTNGVKDVAGNALATDRTWQFVIDPGAVVVLQADFDTGTDGFSYLDGPFRDTFSSDPYVSGSRLSNGGFTGGGLHVIMGGLDTANILNMSGGWRQNFVLSQASEVTISFRYNLTQASDYESDELSQALVTVDGVLQGIPGEDYVAEFVGNGNGGSAQTTGWQLFVKNIGTLSAGQHTITIGAYNNKKTWDNEITEIRIDDVEVIAD